MQKHLFSKTGFATGILSAALTGTMISSVVSSSAFGAGFEKNVLWSGKWVGVGGAAVSKVQGAESLFFNPAGLAMDHQGFEVSGNFSPTWGQFKGPIAAPNQDNSTGYNFSPVFGALVDYGITPQWGVGVGAFVSAGTKADYANVSGFPTTGVPVIGGYPAGTSGPVQSDIYSVEYSIGTGYELIPGLKIGAAWRIVQVKAGLKTPSISSTTGALTFASIDNISATRYNGFRAGIQYTPEDKKWGFGVNYRSSIDFSGTGDLTGYTVAPTVAGGATTTLTPSKASVATALPTQIEVGANYAVVDNVRLFLDYAWTNYSHNQVLNIVSGGTTPINSITLGWKNMSNVRFAAECTALQDWAFRAGYVYTSQVTPESYARATFTAPGHGNTITVGAGHNLSTDFEVNGAVERSWTSGTTTAAEQSIYGDYNAADWALHLGATLRL